MGLRIGTRGSALALAQARAVAERLPGSELVEITTSGDRGAPGGDKSRWVNELEAALMRDEIDVAVHSAKDVPNELPEELEIVAVPKRADPRDVLCPAAGLSELPAGASVGTSSLRREAQLRAAREDLRVVSLRGNVDTRLEKLRRGECDALVVAFAGLQRLGRAGEAGARLDPEVFVPAPGQGTLAVEARAGDDAVRAAVAPLTDRAAHTALRAERALMRALGASCETPVGGHARPVGDAGLALSVFIGTPDGSAWLRDRVEGPVAEPEALAREAADRALSAGGRELLEAAGATA